MSAISKYVWLGYTSARSNVAYFGEVVMRTIFMAVILYIFGRLWTSVYAEAATDRVGGLTLPEMIWYLVITEAILVSTPRVSIEIDEDVRSGRLAVELLRPLSYLLSKLWSTLGERCIRFAVNVLAGGVIAILIVGPIGVRPKGVVMFLLVLAPAFTIEFLGYFMIGLGAFWLENTRGLTLIYSRASMILGGMLLPLEVFPEGLQPIVKALPFASIVYAPARMFVAPDAEQFVDLLIRQTAAVVVFAAIAAWLQRRALRRLHVNGG